ncbi:MAG: hypothetical protein WDA16_14390, partial [Candidatus Thermoplasmatota archaeon]
MRTQTFIIPTLVFLAILPTFGAAENASIEPVLLVSDGKTPTLTPQGTWIIPPPGAPMRIIPEDPSNIVTDETSLDWMHQARAEEATVAGTMAAGACVPYQTGWYETDSASLYGGHMGIVPQNMPPNTSNYCTGAGMGYTNGVSFGATSWIQAGLAIFPAESSAKWFCQSNNNGAKSTSYGSANAYGNGATVYTWFSRDSGGVWRTYRYDTGPWSVQLPCSITRGTSGNLQVYGEIQSASSTSAPMGPWKMFDLRYQATSGSWYVPTQVQAIYPGGTPCPPYGAGTVSSGTITAGSGQTCS